MYLAILCLLCPVGDCMYACMPVCTCAYLCKIVLYFKSANTQQMRKTIGLNFNTCIFKEVPLCFVDVRYKWQAECKLQSTELKRYIAGCHWYLWNEQNTYRHMKTHKKKYVKIYGKYQPL